MSNIGLEIALRDRVRMIRTPVGDKRDGGDADTATRSAASGRACSLEHLWTGDGVTALAVLRDGRRTSSCGSGRTAQTFPQTLVNVRVREKRPIADVPEISAAVARVESAQDGRGRVLVRYSGTEPLLRVMIEGEDQASVQAWAEEIAEAVRSTLG
jgi:phosphoglucosamine mutase